MGLPSIDIVFTQLATSAVSRSEKGTVALLVKDAAALVKSGGYVLKGTADIPTGLSAANRAYVERTFLGYVNPPRRVLLYVVSSEETDLSDGLTWAATQRFDYLAGPESCTAEEAAAIKTWVIGQRDNYHAIYKAVLPNCAANHPAIINFTSTGMTDGVTTWTAAQYCSRIAGLLAGTPMDISCTFAALPELTDVTRMTDTEADEAIDDGELILIHDGVKVKVGRGVTSYVTTTPQKGAVWKKIKKVEILDMIDQDIRTAIQDTYCGKRPNTYDDKCVVFTAITNYFAILSRQKLVEPIEGVGIPLERQREWLEKNGIDTTDMSEQAIKEANTGEWFAFKVMGTAAIVDAMEDFEFSMTVR